MTPEMSSTEMSKKDADKTKVLFVCVGNACRSQMAEALARAKASDVIEPSSAGLAPFGEIVGATRSVLAERGIPIDGQYSKALTRQACDAADRIVNMSGHPADVIFSDQPEKVEDWQVRDPYGQDLEGHRHICDEIDERVSELARRLREKQAAAKDG